MNAQQAIWEAIRERGYTRGWTLDQIVGRQIEKLVEEIAELALVIGNLPTEVQTAIRRAGEVCRSDFDNAEGWWSRHSQGIRDLPVARSEAADIGVVALALGEVISRYGKEMTGEEFDIIVEAKAKATEDIRRGVRNGKPE